MSTEHNFWRERRVEADSNRGPSAYQPNALPLGQNGSLLVRKRQAVTLYIYIRLRNVLTRGESGGGGGGGVFSVTDEGAVGSSQWLWGMGRWGGAGARGGGGVDSNDQPFSLEGRGGDVCGMPGSLTDFDL